MTKQHPGEDELILVLYGESEDKGPVAVHVEQCESCQASLRELQRTLAAVDAHAIPERGPGYGQDVWAHIEPRLEAGSRGRFAWLAPRRLVFAGGIALLVAAAFVAGRYSSTAPPESRTQAVAGSPRETQQATTNSGAPLGDRVLLVAVGDHLDRSQMVLSELMNSPVEGDVDISGTQEWARELVPTNRLIRQTARKTGEAAVADVLGDLERLLMEISHGPSQLSNAQFERIRQRVEAQGLLFKIRVLDADVRQREDPAPGRASL